MKTLNIVIPVLNEEKDLMSKILQSIEFLEQTNISYCITIADNGSTDNTANIAQELCIHNPKIEYLAISHKGVGIALKESILHNQKRSSPHDFIGYMDLDLSTKLNHLCEVYELLCKGCDIVIGSRLLKDSKVIGRSIKREISSRGLNLILKILLKVKFSDAMCGFKFYQSNIANFLITQCNDDKGWFYCAQMLIIAQYRNISIKELPVIWQDDANSKVKIMRLSLSYLKQIFILWGKKLRGRL